MRPLQRLAMLTAMLGMGAASMLLLAARSTTPAVRADHPPSAEAATSPSIARLMIPTIGVDAALVPAGLEPDGRMAAPEGPFEVVWYDFTPKPGDAGNAVLAGHVNWRDGSRAVFEGLHALRPHDRIH